MEQVRCGESLSPSLRRSQKVGGRKAVTCQHRPSQAASASGEVNIIFQYSQNLRKMKDSINIGSSCGKGVLAYYCTVTERHSDVGT